MVLESILKQIRAPNKPVEIGDFSRSELRVHTIIGVTATNDGDELGVKVFEMENQV
jgi:hypothetical protein